MRQSTKKLISLASTGAMALTLMLSSIVPAQPADAAKKFDENGSYKATMVYRLLHVSGLHVWPIMRVHRTRNTIQIYSTICIPLTEKMKQYTMVPSTR